MKRLLCFVIAILLMASICTTAYSADFSADVDANILQDVEDNTSVQSAQDIESGQTAHGNLELPSKYHITLNDGTVMQDYMDMDYFKFVLTERSSILIAVFPIDYVQDDYFFATVSKEDDKTIARTSTAYAETSKQQMSILSNCTLDAGTYYITVLNDKNDTKYNKARYICYFEAVPTVVTEVPRETDKTTGLSNFTKLNSYIEGQYSDILPTSWCAENVKAAYEYGIMKGKNDTFFDSASNLTIAQTIVMACRLHSIYYGDNYAFTESNPWYQSYVDYAIENGIVTSAYENYDSSVSRAGFAEILNNALPDDALQSKNTIEENSIPDITEGSNYYSAVYHLYRAGILTGNDAHGTFTPFSKITRGAAAAIVSRMANAGLRKSLTLKVQQAPLNISLSASSHTINVGKGIGLTAVVNPSSATDKTVTWSSSNRGVASVDTTGYVFGNAPGKATITATTSNGKTASCVVTVLSSASKKMKVTISASCSNYNHVGNEWYTYFSVDGASVRSGSVVSISMNSNVSVYTEITEDDTFPDVGADSYSCEVTHDYYTNGFTITQTIGVLEDRGRYAGNVATWIVKYTFS